MTERRRCAKCGEVKSADQYYSRVRNGRMAWASECIPCFRARQRALRQERSKDPSWVEGRREYERSWRTANRDRVTAVRQRWIERQPDWRERERIRGRDYVARRRARREADPDFDAACRLYQRNYRKLRLWGLTPDDLLQLRRRQGDRCAICRTPFGDGPKDVNIDHNHETGHLRGLLCNRCNLALGLFRDDPGTLRRALVYLRQGIVNHALPLKEPA